MALLSTSDPCFIRTRLVREPLPVDFPITGAIRGPSGVFRLMRSLYGEEPQEVLVVFLLNVRNEVAGMVEVSRGTADSALVHPREVFRAAIVANAAGVIVSHNHPTGDPTPSAEDRAVTRKLAEAGEVIGIRLLDHVVVGSDGWVSILEEEGMP